MRRSNSSQPARLVVGAAFAVAAFTYALTVPGIAAAGAAGGAREAGPAQVQWAQDAVGIFFDANGVSNQTVTTVPYQPVTAYLTLLNPSQPSGVSGWECCVAVEDPSTAYTTGWTFAGNGLNVATPPCLQVGLPAYPLPSQASVVLATFTVVQISAVTSTGLLVRPYSLPSLPGTAVYAAGHDPGLLVPMTPVYGGANTPVAIINPEEPRPPNVLGLYFDPDTLPRERSTTEPNELVTAYLVMSFMSRWEETVGGWECSVETQGSAVAPVWQLAGGGVNALTAPDFRVTCAVPPPAGESNHVVLATLQFIQPNPEDVTLFYIHPAPNATVPSSPSYYAAGQPLNSRALVLSSGDESEPVAGVGPGPVGVGTPPPALAVTTGGVTVRWRCELAGVDGFHVYRRVDGGPAERRTDQPLAAGAGVVEFVDGVSGLAPGASLRYSYAALSAGEEIARSAEVTLRLPAALPARAVLWPPYPNPFNPETTLSFDLAQPGTVRLELFDLAGRRVRTLCAEALGAGAHQRRWDGRDETGRAAPSGAYYARLAVDGASQMRKLSLVR